MQAGTSFRTPLAALHTDAMGEAEIRNTEARHLILSGGLCEEEQVSSALDSEPGKTNFRVGARAGSRLYLHTLTLALLQATHRRLSRGARWAEGRTPYRC